MRARQFLLVAPFALALATAPAAHAEDNPGCTRTCGGAAFSPAFSDSPVTLVICTVPDSCRFGSPK
jgi:hypothetical protein